MTSRAALLAAALAASAGAVELAARHALFSRQHRLLPAPAAPPPPPPPRATPGSANCTTRWFTQRIDHFSFAGTPTGALTYPQRYLTFADYWRNDTSGALWVYVGNEGDVGLYADHSGLMWENAAAHGAYIAFLEHRYYGQSQPFGSASALWLEYLTHEQALADYAAIIFALQAELGAGAQPVIVFGGSYGGKLAAWMRLKYPGVVAGAVAASAPVLFFEGTTPDPGNFEQFWRVVTRDMTPAAGAAPACAANVRAAWDAIDAAAAADLPRLSALFQLCTPLASPADVYALKILHLNAWDTCAMGDYPYPSNYLTSNGPLLPAFPVRAMCALLANATLAADPWALLAAFNAAGAVFNNATQNVACYALPTDLYLDGIWDYQYCTETLPEETYFTRDGVHDAFWPENAYNKSAIEAHCFDKFGVTPRWTWIREQYGGARGGTNIVWVRGSRARARGRCRRLPAASLTSHLFYPFFFGAAQTNGDYDPWSAGGVLPNTTLDTAATPAFLISEGAHHLDLFFSNPGDPSSVTDVRLKQMALVAKWSDEWRAAHAGAGEGDL